MLGLEGIAVPLGFILTVFSTLLCIAYGVINWNRGALSEEEITQEQAWNAEKEKLEERL